MSDQKSSNDSKPIPVTPPENDTETQALIDHVTDKEPDTKKAPDWAKDIPKPSGGTY